MSSDAENITLSDQNKVRTKGAKGTSILSKSIESRDLSFLQEFLHSAAKKEEIEKLSVGEKESLVLLLAEFLDQPVRLEAIETIYEIINSIGRVEGLCKKLIDRSVEFNKLVCLKGKIDYLKYLNNKEDIQEPENEYCE